MTNVKITGITLPDAQKPWDNGDVLRAVFDCEVNGFRLLNCVLIYTNRGFWLAQPPKIETAKGLRAIQICDPSLRKDIAEAAINAYNFFAVGAS